MFDDLLAKYFCVGDLTLSLDEVDWTDSNRAFVDVVLATMSVGSFPSRRETFELGVGESTFSFVVVDVDDVGTCCELAERENDGSLHQYNSYTIIKTLIANQ